MGDDASSATHQVMRGLREPPSEVVILGTSLAPLSVAAALAAATGVAQVMTGAVAWLTAPAVGTTVYVAASALQLDFARRYEEKHLS